MDNKLHVEVLAQSNSSDGGSSSPGGDSSGGGSSFGYYEGYNKVNVKETFNGYVSVSADGIITKALGVSFEGGVKYSKEITYNCCQQSGGYCSKMYAKCSNMSLMKMIVGTTF